MRLIRKLRRTQSVKILTVSPVPTYATWDVFEGHVQGLRANGVEVERMEYSKIWNMFADFKEFMEVTGRAEYNSVNHTLLAGDRVVSAAIVLKPDLVHFIAPMHISPVTLRVLKEYANVKTSAYFTECPYDDEWAFRLAEFFDYCFVCDKVSVGPFRERNPNTHYVGHAYNPDVHHPNGKEREKEADVLFIGTNFPSRIAFLERVDWTGIDLRLHGLMRLGASPLKPYVRGDAAIPNASAINLYRKARIGLQLHRKDGYDPIAARQGKKFGKGGLVGARPLTNLVAHSLGPRSYELAACGIFQICDEGRAELREVFGDTVPTYKTPDDLSALLRTYLDDPMRREELAQAQHEAIKPHTFEARMRTLLEAL